MIKQCIKLAKKFYELFKKTELIERVHVVGHTLLGRNNLNSGKFIIT
jgi:hypothetical protein